MNIAAMRVCVTFQKNAVTVDKYGNHKTGWTDYFSCWRPSAQAPVQSPAAW